MNRPHIICHMVTSIDGKVTGEFLSRPECEKATDIYYELNREYNKNGANGFICGRVTMESSFTGGWYPDLTRYEPVENKDDFIPDNLSGFYAVSFDPKGKLGWKNSKITDEDPGYDDAQIIEVLTEQADSRYLAYLQSMEVPYIFAGEKEIDVNGAYVTPSFIDGHVHIESSMLLPNEFAKAVDRMIAGEYLDTELEGKEISKETLEYIHINKRCFAKS